MSWDAGGSSSQVSKYVVEYSTDSGFSENLMSVDVYDTSVEIKNLRGNVRNRVNRVRYYAQVKAVNSNDESGYLNCGNVETTEYRPLALYFGSFLEDRSRVEVLWEDVNYSHGPFLLEYAYDEMFDSESVGYGCVEVSGSKYVLRGLANRDYYFRVRGQEQGELLGVSNVIVLTLGGDRPVLSINLVVRDRSLAMSLRWTDTRDDEDEYVVEVSRDRAFRQIIQKHYVVGMSAFVKLSDAREYYFRVGVRGENLWSNIMMDHVPSVVSPSGLVSGSQGRTSIDVSWTGGISGGETVTGLTYLVEWVSASDKDEAEWSDGANYGSVEILNWRYLRCRIAGLTSGHRYAVRVRMNNLDVGEDVSPWSNVLEVTTQ